MLTDLASTFWFVSSQKDRHLNLELNLRLGNQLGRRVVIMDKRIIQFVQMGKITSACNVQENLFRPSFWIMQLRHKVSNQSRFVRPEGMKAAQGLVARAHQTWRGPPCKVHQARRARAFQN